MNAALLVLSKVFQHQGNLRSYNWEATQYYLRFGCFTTLEVWTITSRPIAMRLTYIYFLIAFIQGSHDFSFDMGRMGTRAGKLTSPEFFDGSTCAQYV